MIFKILADWICVLFFWVIFRLLFFLSPKECMKEVTVLNCHSTRRKVRKSVCWPSEPIWCTTWRRRDRVCAGYVRAWASKLALIRTTCSFLPRSPHQTPPPTPLTVWVKMRSLRSRSKWLVPQSVSQASRLLTRFKLLHRMLAHGQRRPFLHRAARSLRLCPVSVWTWTPVYNWT